MKNLRIFKTNDIVIDITTNIKYCFIDYVPKAEHYSHVRKVYGSNGDTELIFTDNLERSNLD